MTQQTLGTSNRTQTVKGQEVAPVQHAATWTRWSRYSRTYRAVCGRQVRRREGQAFDPEHPRACRDCKLGRRVVLR